MNTKIIDVRTREEFAMGHTANAINIPLGELPNRLDEIRQLLPAELVLCCASGARSAQAANYLQMQRIACRNGGSWMAL